MAAVAEEPMPPVSAAEKPMQFYAQRSAWQVFDPTELRSYWELAWILGLRDIKIRYKQTAIGVAWALIQPLVSLLVFCTLFGLLGTNPSTERIPYGLAAIAGIVAWQFTAGGLLDATRCMAANRQLITKVYFPRVLLLIAQRLPAAVELAIGMGVMLAVMAYYGTLPGWRLLGMPVVLAAALLVSLALSLWLASLNAIYRDFEHAVPFGLQMAFFASPVMYETNALIPVDYRLAYAVNPAVGVLEGFRWCVSPSGEFPLGVCLVSLGSMFFLLLSGAWYFQRMERHFADRV